MRFTKMPPHSLEAEQSVLGGLLLNNDAWEKIADVISAVDFYREDHRVIFRAIEKLIEANKPADSLTVAESLKNSGALSQIGGFEYIQNILESTPSAANIRIYADLIHERSLMRALAGAAEDIADTVYTPAGKAAAELLDQAEKKIFDISEMGRKTSQGFVGLSEVLGGVMERLDELSKNPSSVVGIATGFNDLDTMTTGLHPGDLNILAGRPSMGKTAMALNMAEHVAMNLRLPVAVFSMEMGSAQLVTRLLSSVSKVDSQKLRTGALDARDWDRVNQAMVKLNDAPLMIDDSPALTSTEVRARARRIWRQYQGLGLIIVDYLQLMSSSTREENRATEISEISRSLKALAKELKVPVVALSQLNRSLEQRPNKRPVMSDLRESGAIEQDADVIMFVYRDEVYNPESPDKGTAEIIVGKQRNGPIGTVRLTFIGGNTRFENHAHTPRTPPVPPRSYHDN